MISEILVCYEKKLRLKGYSRNTIRSYVQHVHDFLSYSIDVVESEVAEYLNELKIKVDLRHVSRSHYNQVQYALNAYWEIFYGRRLPLLDRLEVTVIPPQIINKEDVIEAIGKISYRRDRIIFCLGYFSMLRRTEIQMLDIYKDIDLRNCRVYVRAGKGWKPRVTLLSAYTAQLIREEIAERQQERNRNPWVCAKYSSQERYLSKSKINMVFKDAGCAIGADNWHTHLLRHTGASHLDDQDISTRKIQRLLGHSKISTTQTYLHPSQDHVLEVKNELDEILLRKSNKTVANC